MKLKDYLAKQRGRQSALARAIGAHGPDVCAWASGARNVPVHYGPAIELATDGEVTRQDLFPDDWRRLWPELAKVTHQNVEESERKRNGGVRQHGDKRDRMNVGK